MVNLEWYRTFKAIYKQGSMTKAAQDLDISQPNVSVHLAALEHHVGAKLFDRIPKGLIPTEFGKHLYTQITEAIEKLEYVELNYRKSNLKLESTIRLGSPNEYFYSEVCSRISTSDSCIIVQFGLTVELMNQLEKGELDFVIATQKIPNKNITYDHILQESFVIVGSPTIDCSSFSEYLKSGTLKDAEEWLLSKEWYAYSNDLAFIRRFWIVNFNKRPLLTPQYIIPDLNFIIKSISSGNGIGVVSDYLVKDFIKDESIIKIWDGTTPTTNDLYIAYDKSKVSAVKIEEIKRIILLK